MPRKKSARSNKTARKKARSKTVRQRSTRPRQLAGGTTQAARRARRALPRSEGPGITTAGQSGDEQGLSNAALADSESVEELYEEGQAYEAGLVSGVEKTPETGGGEVTSKQRPQDDVPPEYRNVRENE